MPEKVMPGPVESTRGIREAVCIHTRKIYDSCRDKDCIEDLRFYPKLQYVDTINRALSVKGGTAKLLYVYVDVEPVTFNRGFYTIDMRFFYAVTLQAYLSCPAPVTVEGLCVFDKRAILFGSEGNAKIFSSELRTGEPDVQLMRRSNLPIAVVETIAHNRTCAALARPNMCQIDASVLRIGPAFSGNILKKAQFSCRKGFTDTCQTCYDETENCNF